MRSLIVGLLLITLSAILPSLVFGAIVINEVFPKTSDPKYSWVELYNNGTESVSLDRWTLASSTKSFMMNASSIIVPNGFLTFSGSQTSLEFNKEGDTVKLTDDKGVQVDNQSYPGTLGYNTAIGRTTDGGGVWVICSTGTQNQKNDCPEPSPTPTLTPTPTRALTPTNTPVALLETPKSESFGTIMENQVLGESSEPTPTLIPSQSPDFIQVALSRTALLQALFAAVAVVIVVMIFFWFFSHRKRGTVL